MKCFVHHESDAIGLCKQCQKGLCEHCATDLGKGLACKGQHEAEVEQINRLIEQGVKGQAQAPKSVSLANIIYLLMGMLFLGFGYYESSSFLLIFGALLAGFWLVLLVYNLLFFRRLEEKGGK